MTSAIPSSAGLNYRSYQLDGVEFMLRAVEARQNGVLNADEPGLGKTIMSAGLVNARPEKFKRILVVCPSSGRRNWKRELKKWLVHPLRIRLWGGEADTSGCDVLVTSYEHFLIPNRPKVPSDCKTAFKVMSRGGSADEAMAEQLAEAYGGEPPALDPIFVALWKEEMLLRWAKYGKALGRHREGLKRFRAAFGAAWDLVIVDECKKIKNPASARTKTVLSVLAGFYLFLDGTPIMNRTIELFPVLSVIDPHGLGADRMRFAQEYCGAWHNGFGWQWEWPDEMDAAMLAKKERAEAKLASRLRSGLMLRRLKSEVLTELPPKIRQLVLLDPTGKATVSMKRQNAAWRALVQAKGYDAAVRGLMTGTGFDFQTLAAERLELARAKIKPCVEYVASMLEHEEKIVIFAHHHEMLDALAEGLAAHGVAVLDGRSAEKARQDAVDRFQSDPACRVFIGGNDAAGELITLTAASLCVICELPWNMARVTQIEDRLHRLGQRDVVRCHHVVFDGSLDAELAQLIVEKQALADGILDRKPVATTTKPEGLKVKTMLSIEGTPEELANVLALLSGNVKPCQCDGEIKTVEEVGDLVSAVLKREFEPASAEEKPKRSRRSKAETEAERNAVADQRDAKLGVETPAQEKAEEQPEPEKAETPGETKPAAPEVTLEQVRAVCSAYARAAGTPAAKALILAHGKAEKLDGVPKENYAALLAATKTALDELQDKAA